jgi:hypothetical protein
MDRRPALRGPDDARNMSGKNKQKETADGNACVVGQRRD